MFDIVLAATYGGPGKATNVINLFIYEEAFRSLRFPESAAMAVIVLILTMVLTGIFLRGSRKLAREVLEVDAKVVDGVVNLTGLLTLGSGEGLKYLENGRAQFYALIVFAGVIALVVLFGVLGAPTA